MALKNSESSEVNRIYVKSIKQVFTREKLLIFMTWNLKINLESKPMLLDM